ncbi:unnamed protein product [Phytophthora fragariaefolia]|uniref:Unnamed protein product n=1 Tax=Phytophthora fragariaefolia TaxID=1490495 RepID=A0A9W6WZ96_9STRA|nr:unnamed protein product [Phytophthora fragariaefolia]
MIRTQGPDPTINNSLDDPASWPPVRLAVGVEAAGRRRGSDPPDSVDRREAVERLQTAEFAALRQEVALLKAQIGQVLQTASNVQADLGSRLAVLRTHVGALEQTSAPSHQKYMPCVASMPSTAQRKKVGRRRMLDGMSNMYALPWFANTVNGPMKRGARLLAPKSEMHV